MLRRAVRLWDMEPRTASEPDATSWPRAMAAGVGVLAWFFVVPGVVFTVLRDALEDTGWWQLLAVVAPLVVILVGFAGVWRWSPPGGGTARR